LAQLEPPLLTLKANTNAVNAKFCNGGTLTHNVKLHSNVKLRSLECREEVAKIYATIESKLTQMATNLPQSERKGIVQLFADVSALNEILHDMRKIPRSICPSYDESIFSITEKQATFSVALPNNDIKEAILVSVAPTHAENHDCTTLTETMKSFSVLSES